MRKLLTVAMEKTPCGRRVMGLTSSGTKEHSSGFSSQPRLLLHFSYLICSIAQPGAIPAIVAARYSIYLIYSSASAHLLDTVGCSLTAFRGVVWRFAFYSRVLFHTSVHLLYLPGGLGAHHLIYSAHLLRYINQAWGIVSIISPLLCQSSFNRCIPRSLKILLTLAILILWI